MDPPPALRVERGPRIASAFPPADTGMASSRTPTEGSHSPLPGATPSMAAAPTPAHRAPAGSPAGVRWAGRPIRDGPTPPSPDTSTSRSITARPTGPRKSSRTCSATRGAHLPLRLTGPSGLNQVELWFRLLLSKGTRRGIFRSESELGQALPAYANLGNDSVGASRWIATPEEILAKSARTRLTRQTRGSSDLGP